MHIASHGAGAGLRGRRGVFAAGVASVLCLSGPPAAPAVTIRHDADEADYRNLGQGLEYEGVGSFVGGGAFNGSAILIAPDWILTAAHLVMTTPSGVFTLNGTSYNSTALYRHPSWTGNVFGGYDFALLQLSSAVPGVAPAVLYGGTAESSLTGVFVGFGMTGTGLTGYQPPPDGLKRGFENEIDGDFGNPSILLGCDFDNPLSAADSDFGSAIPLPLEGAAANGDSGGGVFVRVGNVTYLAGVISFVAARDGLANGDYGDVTGFGRVSAVLPWINSTIAVPEPSSGALCVAGLAAFLAARRRRSRIAGGGSGAD